MSDMDNPFFNVEEFNWLKMQSRSFLPTQLLSGVEYNAVVESDYGAYMRDQLVMEINARILGKELPSFCVTDTQVFDTPKNPWQHFKCMYADKWFMRWVVNRWPVKFIKQKISLTATWEQWAVYPWIDKVPVTQGWQPVRVVMPARTRVTMDDIEK